MEFFGISGGVFLIILIVATIVLGPEAITGALRGFRKVVDAAKGFSARVREETSADIKATGLHDIDLSGFDMSGLDPRQMIREAVQEEMQAWARETGGAGTNKKPPTHRPPQ